MILRSSTVARCFLIASIVLSENFLYLIDKSTNIVGLNIMDVGLIIVLCIGVLYLLMTKARYVEGVYHYKLFIAIALLLVITSSLQSLKLYGQPIFLGIRPQRFFLLWCFSYYPLRKAMIRGDLTYEYIEKSIYYVGTLELFLYIGQYFIGSNVSVIKATTSNVYSTSRYYVNTIFLCFLLFICLDKMFRREKFVVNLLIVVGVLFEIVIVGKMRMTSIAVIAAMAVGILLWRKGGTTKVFVVAGCLVGFAIICQTEVFQSILPTINGTYKYDTLSVREVGREFYLSVLKEYPLFGGGYINTQFEAANRASRVAEGIYWVDNGIFGFAYFYGFCGVLWVLYILIKNGRVAFELMKNGSYIFFLVPIYWLTAAINEAHWYFCNFFVVILFVVMIEYKYYDCDFDEIQDENEEFDVNHVRGCD